jgi:hypothetical protein
MVSLRGLLAGALLAAVARAHIVVSYPLWRGNNLITNATFPYGMQWMFPCGGMNVTQNRTYWPTTGGAVAFQPGWFQGHKTAFTHINLGLYEDGPDGGPLNFTGQMKSVFQIVGPTNNPFPGTVCFPQVSLPANTSVKAGQKATIQIVELAQHGAALYSCADIIFAEPGDKRIPEVNGSNCLNSTDLSFADVYTIVTAAGAEGALDGSDSGAAAGPGRRAAALVSGVLVPLVLAAAMALA